MTTSHKRVLLAIQCVPGKDDDLIQWTRSIRSGDKQERLKTALRFAIAAENAQPSVLDRIEGVLTEQADHLAAIRAEQEAVQTSPALRAITENTNQLLDSVDALDKLTSDLLYRVGQGDQSAGDNAIDNRLADLIHQFEALRSDLASGAYSTQNGEYQEAQSAALIVTQQASAAEQKAVADNIARSSSSW